MAPQRPEPIPAFHFDVQLPVGHAQLSHDPIRIFLLAVNRQGTGAVAGFRSRLYDPVQGELLS